MMCGPLAHALPVGQFQSDLRKRLRFTFIVGRWAIYAAMGAMVSALQIPISWLGFQKTGLWFIIMALFFVVAFWKSDFFLTIRQRLQVESKRLTASSPYRSFWILGMANGMLPCGAVYGALALSGISVSPTMGALGMLVFGMANSWWHYVLILGIRVPSFSLGRFSFIQSSRASLAIVVLVLCFRLIHISGDHSAHQGSNQMSQDSEVCRNPK